MSNTAKFLDLLRQSVITQGILAILLILTTCIILIMQNTISKELLALDTLILGFYFGSKTQYAMMKGQGK
jgi:hypothetical protein